jgi:3-hydroxyacyl-[acyl-carrier-protein] dehydratase
MLLESFYKITAQHTEEESIVTNLIFLEGHRIYNGHFPNNPITPGVCLLQTAKELLEGHLNVNLRLNTLVNAKFLKLVMPDNSKELTYTITPKSHDEANEKKVTVTIKDSSGFYIKAIIIYSIL